MNWLYYLLEANLYLSVFYAGYCLFLNKETYYTLNRIYLLVSCIISFVLPLMQIGKIKPVEPQLINVVLLPPVGYTPAVETNSITLDDIALYAYLFGVVILTTILIFKLVRLAKLTGAANDLVDDKYKMIRIEGSNTAFSFFNYLFIGTKTDGADTIIRHELVHIRQKHSADIIFLEIMKIINWFNPFIYLLHVSLKTVHEYIADEQTAALEADSLSYSSFLVNNAYGISGSSVAHSFFNHNLLKKRIIMLNQKRSGSLARLKYLLALPIFSGLLCVSTLAFSKSYGWFDVAPRQTVKTSAQQKGAPIATADTDTYNRVTSKGYRYEETGFWEKGKTEYRVMIRMKNGDEVGYFKNRVTASERQMLKDKYGYTFPNKEIEHLELATLPPLQNNKGLKMPPPPADPARSGRTRITRIDIKGQKTPPPPPPAAPGAVNAKLSTIEDAKLPPLPPQAKLSKHGKPPRVKIIDVKLLPPPPPPADPKEATDLKTPAEPAENNAVPVAPVSTR